MKISKIHLNHLRNDAHFQFHTELKEYVEKIGAGGILPKIMEQLNVYLPLYVKLDEGLKKVNKSAITKQIQEADKARDEIWSGILDMNKAATKHFESNVRDAADRLKILFDTYGNLANQPLNEETSAIYNLLQDLEGKYAADTKTVGIDKWATELKARNKAFSNLMKERFDETADKCDVVVKQARAELDKAYNTIIERINALAIVEGAAAYEGFIRKWNAVVDKYAAGLKRKSSPLSEPLSEPGLTTV